MCDVPSIAVFCSESIECFPGTVPKFFLKLLVTIPVAPIITGTIVHFRFRIGCILLLLLLLLLLVVVTVNSSYSGTNVTSCDLCPDSYKCPFRTLVHTLQEIPHTY